MYQIYGASQIVREHCQQLAREISVLEPVNHQGQSGFESSYRPPAKRCTLRYRYVLLMLRWD